MKYSKNRKLSLPGNGGKVVQTQNKTDAFPSSLTDVLLLKPHSGLKPTLLNRLKAEV